MLSKFYIPASGDLVFISVHGPVYGDAHKNFHSPSREYDLELTIPLAGMQSKYCIPASGDNFAEMHIKIYIPPSREYDPESTVPLAGMQSKFYIPASGDFVFLCTVPASGDAHENLHFPLAGIRSGINNSACGDAIKILHSRERSFCKIFAEMHIEIYIPPSREYESESTVPLAGVQSKFNIPASGDFVIISVHRARERRCTWKFTFPTRVNTIQNRQFRLRECNQNFTSPQTEIL